MERPRRLTDLAKKGIPTAITAVGLGAVLVGTKKGIGTKEGFLWTLFGRLCDLGDGYVARKFGLESRVGAIGDAFADKVAVTAMGIDAWRHDTAPKWELGAMVALNGTTILLTIAAKHRHPEKELVVSQWGKWFMAAENVATGSHALSQATADEYPRFSRGAEIVGTAASVTAIGLGIVATVGYGLRAFRPPINQPN